MRIHRTTVMSASLPAALVLTALQAIPATAAYPPDASCHILGTGGPDVLVGPGGREVICGRGGNDTIKAEWRP
jgi:hypothetical protein